MSIVYKLRQGVDTNQIPDVTDRLMDDAANEINRLTAEVDELRWANLECRGVIRKLRAALDSARKEAKFIADDIDAALANAQDERREAIKDMVAEAQKLKLP